MKNNYGSVNRRSTRAESFRAACSRYRIGFFACLTTLILSEIDLDLSNQIGERIKFHLNPSADTVHNQADSLACKRVDPKSAPPKGGPNAE